ELALADLATVEKQLAKHSKAAKAGGDKESRRLVAALERVSAALDQARPARSVDLYPEERAVLKPLFLLTMKPTMYVANVSEHGFTNNPLLAAVEQYAQREGAPVVAISAALESQIADLDSEDKRIFLADMGRNRAGLAWLVHGGYRLVGRAT